MSHSEVTKVLQKDGFLQVEKDDRLLDIFSLDTRRYGIELWEKWVADDVYIVRFHLPFNIKKTQLFSISRKKIEQALRSNTPLQLSDTTPRTEGQEIFSNL
jgi:hypothetical protein